MMSNFGQLGTQMMRGAVAGQELYQRNEEWNAGEHNRKVDAAMNENDLADAGGSYTELARRASEAAAQSRKAEADMAKAKLAKTQAQANKANAQAFHYANKRAATAAKTGTSTVTAQPFITPPANLHKKTP